MAQKGTNRAALEEHIHTPKGTQHKNKIQLSALDTHRFVLSRSRPMVSDTLDDQPSAFEALSELTNRRWVRIFAETTAGVHLEREFGQRSGEYARSTRGSRRGYSRFTHYNVSLLHSFIVSEGPTSTGIWDQETTTIWRNWHWKSAVCFR